MLARGFLFRERVAGEREASQAPTPAIDSLGYIRGFKSYYHTHQWGVTSGEPLLNRGQGLRAFSPLVPAGG